MPTQPAELRACKPWLKEQLNAIEGQVKVAYTLGRKLAHIQELEQEFTVTLYQVMYARPPGERVANQLHYVLILLIRARTCA